MTFPDKVQRLLDAYHLGEITQEQLTALLQIALYEKVNLDLKVLYAKLTQVNGKP